MAITDEPPDAPPSVADPPTVVPWFDAAAQYAWRGLIILVAVAAIIWTFAYLYLVTIPMILTLVLGTFLMPVVQALKNRGVPAALAAGGVLLGALALVAGIVAAMAPSFVRQAQDLRPAIEQGIDELFEWLETGPIGLSQAEVQDMIVNLGATAEAVPQAAVSVVVVVGEFLAALVLTLVLLFFLLKDGPEIASWVLRRMPDRHRDSVAAVGARTWRALGGFMRGTALVALIDAIGIGLGLWFFGVPLVLPLAFLVFLGGFIPVVGAVVTGFVAVIVAWASGGFGTAFGVLVVVLIVQQVESNVLQPVIMRRAVSLHPIIVLAGVTAGAIITGIIGAFLAVPIVAMVAAAGNELRLRHEARLAGVELGATPIGGAWANKTRGAAPPDEPEPEVEAPSDDTDGGSRDES